MGGHQIAGCTPKSARRSCASCEVVRTLGQIVEDRGLLVATASAGLIIVVLFCEKPARLAFPIMGFWGLARLVEAASAVLFAGQSSLW